MLNTSTDILENDILKRWPEVLQTLLVDHTTHKNIIWATDIYEKKYGKDYAFDKEIKTEQITGDFGGVIKPRSVKSKEEQKIRIKEKAEVFTPSWICNAQNNLVDEAWFGRKDVFNREFVNEDGLHTWEPVANKIVFPKEKTWKDYIRDTRLEITCGEAPYLASRYDTITGEFIPIERRIGLLDRKLRIVSETARTSGEWLDWAQEAYKNIYGFEWQGDSLLLARENLLYTFIDYYEAKFGREPQKKSINYIAYIVSWNLWQMDGLKFVVPNSCKNWVIEKVPNLLYEEVKTVHCEGCLKGNRRKHNGIYCQIKDWRAKDKKTGKKGVPIRFVDLLKDKK